MDCYATSSTTLVMCLHSIVVVRQSCKLKVPGSNPGGGIHFCGHWPPLLAFVIIDDETIIYSFG